MNEATHIPCRRNKHGETIIRLLRTQQTKFQPLEITIDIKFKFKMNLEFVYHFVVFGCFDCYFNSVQILRKMVEGTCSGVKWAAT